MSTKGFSADKGALAGIGLMVLAMLVFAAQDALSRHLMANSNAVSIIFIRYCFFVLFVLALAARQAGGIRGVARTKHPLLQILRGVALVVQLIFIVGAFGALGLVETHALFSAYPLIVMALAAIVLAERVTASGWLAVGAAAIGVLVILRPGLGVLSPSALLVLAAACIFAAYSVMTRFVARDDPPMTSFFYTGVAGAAAIALIAPFQWAPPPEADWGWMALLCVIGTFAHLILIRAYEVAPASLLQPFAYLQLVFASGFGIVLFGEELRLTTVAGAAIVVGAGLYAVLAARRSVRA